MNHNNCKKQLLSDIDNLIKLVTDTNMHDGSTFEDYLKFENSKTPAQILKSAEEYSSRVDHLIKPGEPKKFEYDTFNCVFNICSSFFLKRFIKIRWGDGGQKQKPNKITPLSRCLYDIHQRTVLKYREEFHGTGIKCKNQKKYIKDKLLKIYKKSAKNDLINLCWKFISNPDFIEGIHIPYTEEPKAIFTLLY